MSTTQARDARGRFTKATPVESTPVEYADWSVGWYVRGEHVTMGEDWHPSATRRQHAAFVAIALPFALVATVGWAAWQLLKAIADLRPKGREIDLRAVWRGSAIAIGWMTGAVPAWRLTKVATKGAAGLAVGATIVAID